MSDEVENSASTTAGAQDEEHRAGPFFHGTRAVPGVGDHLVAGRTSNYHPGRVMNHVYFTALIETAVWGAELAAALGGADAQGHVYQVEPTGAFEDDPNVTDKKVPGNPTAPTAHATRCASPVRSATGRGTTATSCRPCSTGCACCARAAATSSKTEPFPVAA